MFEKKKKKKSHLSTQPSYDSFAEFGFVQRNKGANGSPILGPGRENAKPFLPPSTNMSSGDDSGLDSGLSTPFSGMSLNHSPSSMRSAQSPMGKQFHTPAKVLFNVRQMTFLVSWMFNKDDTFQGVVAFQFTCARSWLIITQLKIDLFSNGECLCQLCL